MTGSNLFKSFVIRFLRILALVLCSYHKVESLTDLPNIKITKNSMVYYGLRLIPSRECRNLNDAASKASFFFSLYPALPVMHHVTSQQKKKKKEEPKVVLIC